MKKNMANNKKPSNKADKNKQNNPHHIFDWRKPSKTQFYLG
jgi:hypothetical protein